MSFDEKIIEEIRKQDIASIETISIALGKPRQYVAVVLRLLEEKGRLKSRKFSTAKIWELIE